MRETPIQQRIRIDAGSLDVPLWRNNVGAATDISGRLIRYGLANESKAENERTKSSDLIGLRSVLITPAWFGRVVGVFTAVETKASDWHLTPGDARGQAQFAFHEIVRRHGGFAGFARSEAEFREIISL